MKERKYKTSRQSCEDILKDFSLNLNSQIETVFVKKDAVIRNKGTLEEKKRCNTAQRGCRRFSL